MIIEELCPKCGKELSRRVICTYPPVNVVHCNNCGFHDEQRERIIQSVYKPPQIENADLTINYQSSNKPVENKENEEEKTITGADLIKYIVENKAYDLPVYRMGEPFHGEEYKVHKAIKTKAEYGNEDIFLIN